MSPILAFGSYLTTFCALERNKIKERSFLFAFSKFELVNLTILHEKPML